MAKKHSIYNGVCRFVSVGSLALGLSVAPSQWELSSGVFGITAAGAADFLGAVVDGRSQPSAPVDAGLDAHVDIGRGGPEEKLKSNEPADSSADVHNGPGHHMDAGTDGNTDAAAAFGIAPSSGAKKGIYSEGITADRPDVDKGTKQVPRGRIGPGGKSAFDGAGEETD